MHFILTTELFMLELRHLNTLTALRAHGSLAAAAEEEQAILDDFYADQ